MVSSYINALKVAKGYTSTRIAEESGVPLATVKRILAGNTENPTFDNVKDIVCALGGSLDEMCGIENRNSVQVAQDENAVQICSNRQMVVYVQSQASAMVAQLRETLAFHNRIIKCLIIALCVLFALWGTQWLMDAIVPDAGWIQRTGFINL